MSSTNWPVFQGIGLYSLVGRALHRALHRAQQRSDPGFREGLTVYLQLLNGLAIPVVVIVIVITIACRMGAFCAGFRETRSGRSTRHDGERRRKTSPTSGVSRACLKNV